jgi:phage terminase small subunit
MPILSNQRHERFAQELAKGKSAEDAHELAGSKRNRGTACILKQTPSISNRIAELLAERDRKHAVATERAIERLALDREQNAERALQNEAVRGPDGQVIEYRYNGAVANFLEVVGSLRDDIQAAIIFSLAMGMASRKVCIGVLPKHQRP